MPEPAFQINEYVWDKVRKGPGVVVGIDAATNSYTVAEIVENAGVNRLGRIASRWQWDLGMYVKVVMPEEEAQLLLGLVHSAMGKTPILEPTVADSFDRLTLSIQKRGIEPLWSQ